jgi:site-specific recombinase
MSSIVTLFALMVVNNWYVIVSMYATVSNTVQVRWFFLAFYYFGVLIGVNIIIGFAIEMYGAVKRIEEENTRIADLLKNVSSSK